MESPSVKFSSGLTDRRLTLVAELADIRSYRLGKGRVPELYYAVVTVPELYCAVATVPELYRLGKGMVPDLYCAVLTFPELYWAVAEYGSYFFTNISFILS